METLPFYGLDDIEFNLEFFELQNGPINFNYDRLISLNYNPLLSCANHRSILSNDLDPDANFYGSLDNHYDYFIEDQFNSMLKSQKFSDQSFSLFHLNIRSLECNLHNLTNLLSNIDMEFSVIGITETWLKSSTHSVDIKGYNFFHECRKDKIGGGVGLYLSDCFTSKIRNDLRFEDEEVAESLFIEISKSQGKNIVIGIIYRPPSQNVNVFLSHYNDLMAKISKENKICYLMGDFNLNLLNYDNHTLTGEFLDGIYSNSFIPLITRPTRITAHTSTLIDYIFTNNFCSNLVSGLLFTDISDHLPVFVINSEDMNVCQKTKKINVRDKNKTNMNKFIEQLGCVNWSCLESYDDPCNSYNKFLAEYTKVYNTCFPIKSIKVKHHRIDKPWLSRGLLRSIKRKNKLYKQYLNDPSLLNETHYKRYKNRLNHSLRIAKSLYYTKRLESVKSNIKATWRILNEVMNKKRSQSKFPSLFKIDSTEISNPMEIADTFCNYFSNIGPNLANKIQATPNSHLKFLKGHFPNSVFLNPATEKEIIEISKSFQSNKSPGYDQISMSAIKQTIHLISKPLTHIINLSIAHGFVPNEMKIARVIPLFKAGDKALITNYRPISILPNFSKFLERVIYNRLLNFLNKNNILTENQYGFRKNYSTCLALIDLYDKISLAIDNQEFAVGVFLDLSKAFDTINHEVLFDKLAYYGIRGLALEWVKSYFSNRSQFVQFNEHYSGSKNIRCGVPQGSILGPLFFLLYVNDIVHVSRIIELILFADDTNIFLSHKDPIHLTNILNIEIEKLSNWFKSNKLSLNLTKTKIIVFKPRQRKLHHSFQLRINGQCIEQVKETVFLGVQLDEELSWKSHISHIAGKISKSIGIISKASFYLLQKSLFTLYYSIVYPYIDYCNVVWASTYQNNLRRINLLQKRAIRILNKCKFDTHTDPLFKKCFILKVHDIFLLQMGKFIFSLRNGFLPEKFLDMIQQNNQIHSYNTRNATSIRTPLCRTNIRQFAIRFQGPKFFNSLPSDISSATSFCSFKKKLKKHLISKY